MKTYLKTESGKEVYLTALVYDDADETTYAGVAQYSLENEEGTETITRSFTMPKASVIAAAIESFDAPVEPVQ